MLDLLALLRPQLHEEIHQSIARNHVDDHYRRIPPAIVGLVEVHSAQIIAAGLVLTHLAIRSRLGVKQVRTGPQWILRVCSQVLAAGLVVGRIEDCELALLALDLLVEHGKHKKGADEVVEWVDPVQPIAPEGGDL